MPPVFAPVEDGGHRASAVPRPPLERARGLPPQLEVIPTHTRRPNRNDPHPRWPSRYPHPPQQSMPHGFRVCSTQRPFTSAYRRIAGVPLAGSERCHKTPVAHPLVGIDNRVVPVAESRLHPVPLHAHDECIGSVHRQLRVPDGPIARSKRRRSRIIAGRPAVASVQPAVRACNPHLTGRWRPRCRPPLFRIACIASSPAGRFRSSFCSPGRVHLWFRRHTTSLDLSNRFVALPCHSPPTSAFLFYHEIIRIIIFFVAFFFFVFL